jgi:hypothetical protein
VRIILGCGERGVARKAAKDEEPRVLAGNGRQAMLHHNIHSLCLCRSRD